MFYTTEYGKTRVQVKLQDETVWLTQAHLCELFDKDKRTILEHIRNIFAELLARIRDIRSSEKVFWRKVLDIYATSTDYSPNAVMTALP